MRFDKSLKLLNFATNNGGFLELYSELDHSFLAGDKIFIVGGIYDNTEDSIYTSSYNTATPNLYNPFASFKTGYVVLSVNYANNSFVINYPVTSTLIYPYGVINNPFGNPQDSTHLAYNTYTGLDLYKSIYVSKTVFLNGRFRKGTINNGIFGNDHFSIRLNIHENQVSSAVINDLTITHIASKNTTISAGIINSKTDSTNPITVKIKVIEDLTLGFSVTSIPINTNNDSYGYSQFEKLKNFGPLTINNGYFNNPISGNINLNNLNIIKAKIGNKEPISSGANSLINCNLQSGFLSNFTNTTSSLFNFGSNGGGIIDTFINLNPLSTIPPTYGTNPGEIIFTVDYDTIANKIWDITSSIYISGVTPLVTLSNSDIFKICNSLGQVLSVSYTFGSINTAVIHVLFNNLATYSGGWSTWQTNYPITMFNFSKTKLTYNKFDNIYINGPTTISTYLESFTNNIYIDSSTNINTVIEGYYNGISFYATTNFIGTSFGESIYLNNSKQMFQTSTLIIPTFTYVNIPLNITPIKGNFTLCKINGGTIHNSNINSCFIFQDTSNPHYIYLYNSIITGNSNVDTIVYWDKVQFNGTPDTISGTSIIVNSNFGLRKTPWKTGAFATLPLTPIKPAMEFNKIEGRGDMYLYNSQTLVNDISINTIPIKRLIYEIPSLQNIQTTLDTSKFMSIIDKGDMTYFYFNWHDSNNRLGVLFASPLNTDTTLATAITNRSNGITSGTNDTTDFPGPQPASSPPPYALRTIDQNFIYHNDNYHNNSRIRRISDITINVYDNPPVPSGQPDPTYSLALQTYIYISGGSGTIDNIMPGTTTIVAQYDQGYAITFKNLSPSVQSSVTIGSSTIYFPVPATSVPACFIEVERVIITNTNGHVVQYVNIYNANYCPPTSGYTSGGNEYSWDTLVPGSQYPSEIAVPGFAAINNGSFTGGGTKVCIIQIEYWVTWYCTSIYASDSDYVSNGYTYSGKREKRTDTYTLQAHT